MLRSCGRDLGLNYVNKKCDGTGGYARQMLTLPRVHRAVGFGGWTSLIAKI